LRSVNDPWVQHDMRIGCILVSKDCRAWLDASESLGSDVELGKINVVIFLLWSRAFGRVPKGRVSRSSGCRQAEVSFRVPLDSSVPNPKRMHVAGPGK